MQMQLPEEMCQHILEYNPDHREHFSRCVEQIPLSGALSRVRHLTYMYELGYENMPPQHRSIIHIMRHYVQDPDHLVTLLAACKCCERHTRNRPSCLHKYTETPWLGCKVKGCQCICRHSARFLCRTFCPV